ncbi:CPBP family intramembrane glutamic endopeptidase [Rhodanobacter ginsengiterrae]|uniref:CPBP family intramembrane glutamic endopeptidase n=1 Tax=Rhodanobacter ginsengiterrae TaxID=2008451 RepID=UPI003CF1E341
MRRKSPPGLGSAAGLIAGYFALQILVGLMFVLAVTVATLVIHPGQSPQAAIGNALARPAMQAWLAIASLGLAAPLTLWLAHRQWRPWWSLDRPPGLGFHAPHRAHFWILAVSIGLLAPWLGALLTQWLAQGHAVTQDIQQIGSRTPMAPRMLLIMVVVCLGPMVEELLFRGVLLSALLTRWNASVAVTGSSLLFALIHLPGLDYQWYALPNLLLLALLLTALRLRSGSIWPGVLAHGINNLLAVIGWFAVFKPTG